MCGGSPPLSGTKVISTSYAVPDGFDEASFEAELDAEVVLLFAVEPAQIRRYLELFACSKPTFFAFSMVDGWDVC